MDDPALRAELSHLRDELESIFQELVFLTEPSFEDGTRAECPRWLVPLGSVVTLGTSLLTLRSVDAESFQFFASAAADLDDSSSALGGDFAPVLRSMTQRSPDLSARWTIVVGRVRVKQVQGRV